MLTLYWSPRSRAIRTVWMIEELALPYQIREIDIRAEPRNDPDDFRQISPIGKVPALRDGDQAIHDTAPICLYLADRYGQGRFGPAPDQPGRALFLYWMFFCPTSIEPAMMEKFMGLAPNRSAAPWGTWDLMLRTLEDGLAANDYIAGPDFTAADVLIASTCDFMRQFKLIEHSDRMADYVARCLSRPAFLRAAAREPQD